VGVVAGAVLVSFVISLDFLQELKRTNKKITIIISSFIWSNFDVRLILAKTGNFIL